jgi:hypothetical protein
MVLRRLLLALLSLTVSASADEDLSFDIPLDGVDVGESAANAARGWNAAGVAKMGASDALGAIVQFTAASHFSPDRPGVWINLALSLSALASRIVPQSALVLLCEAEQATLLAAHLLEDSGVGLAAGGVQEAEVGAEGGAAAGAEGGVVGSLQRAVEEVAAKLAKLEPVLRARGAAAASCDALPAGGQLDSGALDEAMSLERAGRHVAAANGLCGSSAAVTVALPAPERARGVLSATTMRRVMVLQRVCGLVHLQGALPRALVDELAAAQAAHFAARDAVGDGAAARGDALRLEVPLPLAPPFTDDALVGARFTLAAVRLCAGKQLELDTFSYIHAKAGSRAQEWHIDVPALFEPKAALRDGSAAAAALRHLPPPGVVAVVPLLDLEPRHGPTEFLAGSHVERGAQFWSGPGDRGVNGATPTISVAARRGSVVLFDLRLRHRGGANAHTTDRAVLYMSYVQSWYRDAVNFRERQGVAWDALPSGQLRGLFGRLGTRAYTAALEDALRALGVDVEREHVSAKHLIELAAQARGQKLRAVGP